MMTPDAHRHDRCYASPLNDCSTKITGEHYISAAVLEEFSVDGAIDIGGLAWLGDSRRELPLQALVANVLCDRHNEQLSGLDSAAGSFVRRNNEVRHVLATQKRRMPIADATFEGNAIERWLLKCLCGIVASSATDLPVGKGWRPPLGWLEILFDRTPMPAPLGLYFVATKRDPSGIVPKFAFSVVSNDDLGPYGITASFAEKPFILAMMRPQVRAESMLADAIRRPAEFIESNGINRTTTRLEWPNDRDQFTVQIHHDNPRKKERPR